MLKHKKCNITNELPSKMLHDHLCYTQKWYTIIYATHKNATKNVISLMIYCQECYTIIYEKTGITVIQIDEAALREGLPLRKAEHAFYLDWVVHSFRITNVGVQDTTQIHTHTCYSNFNDIIHSIINQPQIDVLLQKTNPENSKSTNFIRTQKKRTLILRKTQKTIQKRSRRLKSIVDKSYTTQIAPQATNKNEKSQKKRP